MTVRIRWTAGAVLVALLVAVGPARADEPANWVDPAYAGSLTDVAALTEMARNDATATGAGAQPAQGCISAATEPVLREDAESSTRLAVYARVMLWANTACSETWELQYYDSYDDIWFTLGSSSASSSGFGTYHLGDVKAECLAGSWAYRVAGRAWHTRAVRLTCHNPDDPFRIG